MPKTQDHATIYARLFKVQQQHQTNPNLYHKLADEFEQITGIEATHEQMESAMKSSRTPKMNQLVPALLDDGMTNKEIANLFKITAPTVSYHKSHPAKKRYTNQTFSRILDMYDRLHSGRRSFGKTGLLSEEDYDSDQNL